MLTLGLAGGLDPVHDSRLDSPANFTYDGAAVLTEDGAVVAAIEQARLDRIKRSNKFPGAALRFCLEQRGVRPEDVDRIAYYAPEDAANALLARLYLSMPEIRQRVDARTMLAMTLGGELGARIDPARLRFFSHKLTHAAGAMAHSGFDAALVLILDNSGGLFLARRDDGGAIGLEEIVAIPPAKSTTRLCQVLLPFLGLGHLDNQAAVAMAPHGDPSVFRAELQDVYELLPDGDYVLHLNRVDQLIGKVEPRGEEGPGQQHKDLAAALQEAQETIVLHVLEHHRRASGLAHLCMAGGIVENSTTNGKVLAAGLFDEIFVHPAATDAGCALGAALMAAEEAGVAAPRKRLGTVDWGTDAGESARIEAELASWGGFVAFERCRDVARRAAELLARGAVLGWVQGRSEFSPRALGNRNVLADPRPAENRTRLDAVLKRPSGTVAVTPSVLEEDARGLFELPEGTDGFPYMAFAVKAREDRRREVEAALLADGTAWLHTVSRQARPRYWALIDAFKELTGVPAVLTTSYSSKAEPIVDSAEDAVVSFLTTDLDYLAIGDFLASKKTPAHEDWLSLRISLPPYVRLQQTRRFVAPQRMKTSHLIRVTYDAAFGFPVSTELFGLLMDLEGEKPLGDLIRDGGAGAESEQALVAEVSRLWFERLVRLRGAA